MELVTLGTSSAHPTLERASSGYLVREGDESVLIDLGSGSFRNLLRWIDPCKLDAIILSHLHQDHFIDIYPLFYYLLFYKRDKPPIDVYAPQGTAEFILQILPRSAEQGFAQSFRFHSITDQSAFSVGKMRIECFEVDHGQPTFGIRISSAGNVIAYSSDTDYTDTLVELAKDSDIFICEATMQKDYEELKHLTAAEAGTVAAQARAKRLILTHVWTNFNPNESKVIAEEHYRGQIIAAEDNMRISL